MRNGGADRPRQAEHGGVDSSKGRGDQVRARARKYPRLAHQQRAEILKSERTGKQRDNQRANADRPIFPPATLTRNCHHLLTPNTKTAAGRRHCDRFFMA
jgi:hypothetical protein